MNLKTKIFIFVALSLFSVSLVTLPAATAFTSDSFSQKVNDEAIWEVKTFIASKYIPIAMKVGDQVKAIIIAANKTKLSVLCDCLWVREYNNSVTNRTWQLLMPTTLITIYNSTYGWDYLVMPMFIPHNQTCVNSTLHTYLAGMNYTWTSGPNGYDGTMAAWKGTATGQLGMLKYEMKFNANGILQYFKEYNGTGSGWTLICDIELMGAPGIPGFIAFPLIFILSIFVAFQILRAKKKPVAM